MEGEHVNIFKAPTLSNPPDTDVCPADVWLHVILTSPVVQSQYSDNMTVWKVVPRPSFFAS